MSKFNKIIISLFAVLAACISAPAESAEYLPELDNNKYSELPLHDRRMKIANDMTVEAQQLESKGRFSEALNVLDRAIKIGEGRNLQRSLQRVKLLQRLDRNEEAKHSLQELFYANMHDHAVWEPYIDSLIKAHLADAAIKASKLIQTNRWTEEPSWLLARALDAAGKEKEAIQVAHTHYYHFEHLGLPCTKLKAFLTSKGAEPGMLTRITTLNDAVITRIKQISEFRSVPTTEKLREWFPVPIDTKGTAFVNGYCWKGPGFTFVSPGGVLWLDDCNYCSLLVLRIDTDKVSLTSEDLEKIFGKGTVGHSRESHHSPAFPTLTYRSENPELRFAFAKDGIHALTEVRFGWPLTPEQIPKVEKFVPKSLDSVESKLDVARKEMDSGSYRKAAKIIMECWEDAYGDSDRATWYAQIQRKRELLAKAYDGLKQPEVAAFLRVAPMETIRTEILVSDYGKLPLQKIEDYKQRMWTILCEQEGSYKIVYDQYNPPPTISPESKHYKAFYQYFGPMKVWTERKIAPLPLVLVEQMDKALFAVP